MVLTIAQTTVLFFEEPDQMAIPAATVQQLSNEGINTIDDLLEFDKDSIEQIAQNMRRPPAGLPPFTFSAKSQKRLIVACDLVRYYEAVNRPLTAAGMRWIKVVKNFEIQWKALKAKKAEDDPGTRKITKGFNVMKWSESFRDILPVAAQKAVANHVKRMRNKLGQNSTSKVYVTTNGVRTAYSKKEDMERAFINENVARFSQAEGSPSLVEPLLSEIGLLRVDYSPPPGTDYYARKLIPELKMPDLIRKLGTLNAKPVRFDRRSAESLDKAKGADFVGPFWAYF
jgi:hypothetical protein